MLLLGRSTQEADCTGSSVPACTIRRLSGTLQSRHNSFNVFVDVGHILPYGFFCVKTVCCFSLAQQCKKYTAFFTCFWIVVQRVARQCPQAIKNPGRQFLPGKQKTWTGCLDSSLVKLYAHDSTDGAQSSSKPAFLLKKVCRLGKMIRYKTKRTNVHGISGRTI